MRIGCLILVFACTGCPDLSSKPVSSECTKQYEQCKLPEGPLGVCDTAPCPEGKPGPCFRCMPQH